MSDSDEKYRILERIDSGGMAEIYLAEAQLMKGMKRKVAIKRILPDLTRNKKFVAMFLDEARLSLYLNHANIVHVYDIGRSGETYFIVMEYVHGVNLRSLTESVVRQGGFSVPQAIFITMEVCKGLGYAHDMRDPETGQPLNIVHRDVSPPNILLSQNGEVKLVDFGLAKAATQLEHTDPGVVKGKFSYLSPEAASGVPVDWRSDVFSCGIILFELLTSRRLFLGETDYHTVELARQAKIPSIGELNSDVPDELEQIVRRALAREREERFQHAYELQDALAQFLFARGLKVTSRDIAQQVREGIALREQTKRTQVKPQAEGHIAGLITDELGKFTSLEQADMTDHGQGQSAVSGQFSAAGPLNPAEFDERGRVWTTEVRADDFGPSSDLVPLEAVLEGSRSEENLQRDAKAAVAESSNRARTLLIALLTLVLIGAGTIFALYQLGLLPGSTKPNNDLDPPTPRVDRQ